MSTTHPVAWWFAPPHGLAPVETPTYPISAPCTVQGAARFRVVLLPGTTSSVGIEVEP